MCKTDCWECKHFSYERDTNASICDKNLPDSDNCEEYISIFEGDEE